MSMYEVLAPVGNFSEIDVILNEKPDAIYVGMKGFTSRPARTDFSPEEIEYSGLRDTGVRGFGNRHSGSQKTMIPGMETIHTMP